MNNAVDRPTSWINTLIPYIFLLVAGSGIGLTLMLGRVDLTISSLVLVIPLVIGGIVLLSNKNIGITGLELPAYARIHFSNLFLLNMLIYIFSIIVLTSNATRPLIYFILISLFAGIILLQIISKRQNWTDSLIIFQIVLLSLNLLWGVTFKYPLYYGDTDTLVHLHLIDMILRTAHVDPVDIYYHNYPLYHIFTAIGVEITGMSLRTTLFLMMGLAWQIGILFAFLIFRNITHSARFASLVCLLFASSSQLIFYGSYAIARSLAFVFFICWIYFIIKAQKSNGYLLLSLITMGAMIMTHHINVIFVIPIVVLIYIIQLIVNKNPSERVINPVFIYLLTACSISYMIWIASSMTNSTLPETVRLIFQTETFVQGDFTSGHGLSVMMGAVYHSFVLLLGVIGIRIVLNNMRFDRSKRMAAIFAIAGLLMMVVYAPGPVNLLQFSNTVLLDRLGLIVSPFIAFLAAYGIKYFFDARGSRPGLFRSSILTILPFGLVIIMTFFSTISTGNAKDSDYLPHTENLNSPYFTSSELASFGFLNDKANNTLTLYGDYEIVRNEYSFSDFSTRNIIEGGDLSYLENGYLVLRVTELQRKNALSFSTDGTAGPNRVYRYRIDLVDPELNIIQNLAFEDRIYSTRDMQIFIRHQNDIS